MPLGNSVSNNIRELYKDNQKSGKSLGTNGKPRSKKQIVAISLNAARNASRKPKYLNSSEGRIKR